MFNSAANLGFPRRVVALYLLFCVGAMLLLTVGAVFVVQSLVKSQATGDALSQVGRLTAAIEMDRLKSEGKNTQRLVRDARNEGRLTHCAVVGPDGRFVAHSNASLIGAIAVQSVGSQLRWGAIDGVRFQDESGRLVNEYRAPLSVNDQTAGALLMAVTVPGWEGVVAELAEEHAVLAILGPLAFVGLGAWWLRKTASPLASIEQRLTAIARLPHHDTPVAEPLPPSSVAAVGWNRIAAYLDERRADANADPAFQLKQLAASAGGGRTREAIESLAEGVAVTDAEGRIDFANRAVAALLGTDQALDGAAIDDLLTAINPERAGEVGAGNPDAELVSELPLPTQHGDRILRLARTPLAGDATAGHVWSFRDITQQKLAEASRDQFIDTATHELRTPLANIKAYAETLAMCDMSDVEQQKEFCNTINTEATRLARFVDDLLSISSIEVGSLGIDRQNVEVRRLLNEACDKVKPLMKQRSLTFEVALSEQLGEARLDKDKVSGLLVNLLGNAAKYTPEGGSVKLTAVREEDTLKIRVSDTGVGIDEAEQAKVFDKFFRSENPDIKDQVGTGLGLSLAREIAKLHRGELTLESKLGEGSIFTATLPTS